MVKITASFLYFIYAYFKYCFKQLIQGFQHGLFKKSLSIYIEIFHEFHLEFSEFLTEVPRCRLWNARNKGKRFQEAQDEVLEKSLNSFEKCSCNNICLNIQRNCWIDSGKNLCTMYQIKFDIILGENQTSTQAYLKRYLWLNS